MTKDEALKMAIDIMEGRCAWGKSKQEVIAMCQEALEQEERTQRTMHCGTADAFIAMDDDHKRRWFVQSLRESKRRKELEDILEQPAQEPVAIVYSMQDGYIGQMVVKDIPHKTKLYTHPAPSWQGLSDDDVDQIIADEQIPVRTGKTAKRFARAIEQALKEKNT